MSEPATRNGGRSLRVEPRKQRAVPGARRLELAGVLVLALAACSKSGSASVEASPRPSIETVISGARGAAPASETLAPLAAATSTAVATPSEGVARSIELPVSRNGIAWYEDAPEAAFAAARASGRKVLVDLWAPWCHTCLSMQSVVMTADNLPAMAERFVWLAVDTERDENASLLERLPVAVWPTFYLVDPGPADSTRLEVRGRWLGAASAKQFSRFLTESDGAPDAATGRDSGLARALSSADALASEGRHAEAAAAYAALLARAPRAWARRPETLVAQMTALWKGKDIAGCLRLGEQSLEQTGDAASAVDFSHYVLECASQSQPATEGAELVRAVARRLEPLCKRGTPQLSPDDRADACDKLAAARSASGDVEGAKQALGARLAVLERAAHGKPPELASTYDWARTDALLQLGRAEEALVIATEREQQLPRNYNPPHYRAKSLKALGRWQDGLAAIDRALSLAYGPRKVGLLSLKVDLLLGAGRHAEARATLRDQLAQFRVLPAGQRQPAAEARVEQRLRELEAPAPTP